MIEEVSFEFDFCLFNSVTLSVNQILTYHVFSSLELIFCEFFIILLEICRIEELYACFCFNVDTIYDVVDALLIFDTIKCSYIFDELFLTLACVHC